MPYFLINQHFQVTRVFHFPNSLELRSSPLKLYIFTDLFEINFHICPIGVSISWVKRNFKRGWYPLPYVLANSQGLILLHSLSDRSVSQLLLPIQRGSVDQNACNREGEDSLDSRSISEGKSRGFVKRLDKEVKKHPHFSGVSQ